MPKQKTYKAAAKRVKKTNPKSGKAKLLTKTCGRAHFNAKESGKTTRLKRRSNVVSDSIRDTLLELIP